ncbi:MAG: hypothetical protein K1X78_17515 [Verrucomicrobiaceae bacterium]|nr:hypothetical protein [Verrucomicrobiaceae bacterium]
MIDPSDAVEYEQHRQELLKEIENPSDYKLGSFGCHELLDRLHLVSQILQEYVLEHPACVLQPAWYASASEAASTLCDLYQVIGGGHLPATPSDGSSSPQTK